MTDARTTQEAAIDTVLLIDDDAFFHAMCKRLMHRTGLVRNPISFLMAEDALEFLATTDRPRIDVIFLDINMPRMNGFEFLDAATQTFGPDFTELVVMMLTSSLNPCDIERAKSYAVVREFANKPLLVEHIEKIAGILKASRPQARPRAVQ